MITCIFGLPGAGKSSYLAYSAQRASQGKRLFCGFRPFWDISLGSAYPYQRIYSNFPIAGCYKFDWEMVGTFDFSNSLILIDEIMQLCDSRDWKNFGAEKKYFSQCIGIIKQILFTVPRCTMMLTERFGILPN